MKLESSKNIFCSVSAGYSSVMMAIKKLGIPSNVNKWCNRDMKLRPLKKYADSVFGLNNYSIAVGLRIDEMDRVRKDYKDNNVFYPLTTDFH